MRTRHPIPVVTPATPSFGGRLPLRVVCGCGAVGDRERFRHYVVEDGDPVRCTIQDPPRPKIRMKAVDLMSSALDEIFKETVVKIQRAARTR